MKEDNGRKENLIIHHGQFFNILNLLHLFISLYISDALLHNAVFGAAIYIACFTVQSFLILRRYDMSFDRQKLIYFLLGIVIILILAASIVIILINPFYYNYASSLCVVFVTMFMFLRSSLTFLFIKRNPKRRLLLAGQTLFSHLLITAVQYICVGLLIQWDFSLVICLLTTVFTVAVLIWLFFTRREELVSAAHYSVNKISSYRVYSAMLLCSYVSLYLSIMSYINMLIIMPKEKIFFFPIVLWIVLLFISVLLLGHFLKRSLNRFEKNSFFLIGCLLWLLSFLELYHGSILYNPSQAWFWSFIQAFGLALMMILSSYMQKDMSLVLVLTDDINESDMKTNRFVLQQAAFLISGILIFFELSLANFAIEGRIPFFSDMDEFRKGYIFILNLLPLFFVFLSMFFALVQPLNREIVRKLKLYREQKAEHTVNIAFEERLKKLLIKQFRVRAGVKIIAFLLKPLLYHQVKNTRQVDLSGGPVIFIANHREIYGPIIANLYLPFSFRPWIEHRMLERENISSHIWEGSFKRIKPLWLGKLLMKPVVPLVLWVLNSVEPIPVYHKTREILKTIDETVKAMIEQDNILIFPENPMKTENKRYALEGVSQFYSGFVHVAKAYYKKTGKTAKFYPVYANPRKRTITFGQGIAYDPAGKNEPERISGLLEEAINEMAAAAKWN